MSESDLVRKLLADDGDLRALARRLVVDPNDADDLAQDAWLVAVSKRLDLGGPVLGWLARVAGNVGKHLRRSAVRRDRRELAAARPEATSSAADAVERVELRRRLIDAVLALEEPLRTTVVLRFFEGEPPRRIAARFGVPVETVRSRTKRALALLREKLDAGHEGRRSSWLVPLASIAGLEVPAAAATVAASVVSPATIAAGAMVMKAKWGLVCAAVLLLAGTAWFFRSQRPDLPDVAGGADIAVPGAGLASAGEIGAGASSSRVAADSRPAIAPRPFAEEPESQPSKFGGLVVKAVWKSDGKPAAGLRVRAAVWTHTPAFQRTDADGVCRFDRVPVGKALVSLVFDVSQRVDVTPGEVAEATIEIPEGSSITGEVWSPSGEGVEGAEIWLSDHPSLMETDVVARSGPGGRFRIRGIAYDSTRWVGARAPGYGASDLVRLWWRAQEIDYLPLVLKARPGGVRGRVVAPDGAPVPGASVWIGRQDFQKDVAWLDRTPKGPTIQATTNAEGEFAIVGVPSGDQQMMAHAGRYAPWFGPVAVRPDETSAVSIQLGAGATIVGEVVDEADKPIANIGVFRTPYDPLRRTAWTDAGGKFRIEGLAAGSVELEADGGDTRGSAKATVELVSGQETRVRLKFAPGLVISGVVVDERDAPLPGCRVTVDSVGEGEGDYRSVTGGADGTFSFARCLDREYQVRVFEPGCSFPSAKVEHVRPGGERLSVRILDRDRARSHVKGRLLSPDSDSLKDATLALYPETGISPRLERDADGSFHAGPIPAGRYRFSVILQHHSVYQSAEIDLGVGETRDLGEIKLLNRLVLRVSRDDGQPAETIGGAISYRQQADGVFLNGEVKLNFTDGVATSQLLVPGSHDLNVYGPDLMPVRMPVEIRADEETRLEVQLRAGKRYSFEFVDEPGATPSPTVFIHLKRGGKVVSELRLGRYKGSALKWPLVLADGAYDLEALAEDNGRKVSATITVPPPPGSPDPFVFTLK